MDLSFSVAVSEHRRAPNKHCSVRILLSFCYYVTPQPCTVSIRKTKGQRRVKGWFGGRVDLTFLCRVWDCLQTPILTVDSIWSCTVASVSVESR